MSAMKPDAIALAYLRAVERKDRAEVRKLLADDGAFIGPLQSFTQADLFMKAADIFMQLTKKYEIKKVLADGNDVCVFWDYTTIVPSIPVIPIAEWFKIAHGKIEYLHLHFNPAPFVVAVERGEVASALQSC
jgi:SnoaL-like domain